MASAITLSARLRSLADRVSRSKLSENVYDDLDCLFDDLETNFSACEDGEEEDEEEEEEEEDEE